MTATEARERLREVRERITQEHADIERLANEGRHEEAVTKLKAYIGSVDPDEAFALALIAEGKEPRS